MLLTPFVIAILAAAEETGPAEGNPREVTIVAFGDSTTAPRGSLKVYPGLLESDLREKGVPARMINAGVGANTTAMARKRFEKDVLAHKPQLVIVSFGINDAAVDVWKDATTPRVPIQRYKDNLRHFVKELRETGAKVVFFTPNPLAWTPKLRDLYGKPPYDPSTDAGFNILLDEYAEAMRKVAKEKKAVLVDARKAFEQRAGETSIDELLLDGMHPNNAGHRLIADQLLKHIVPLLTDNAVPGDE
jgi:lysophospholipase L1-like esterase